MSTTPQEVAKHADHAIWRQTVAPYERPDLKRSLWQAANSIGPYLVLWWLMVESLYGHVFQPPKGTYGYARLMTPHRKPYPTRDGYMCVLPYTNRQWGKLFELTGQPEKIDEPPFNDHTTRIVFITRNIAAEPLKKTLQAFAEQTPAVAS